SGDRADHRRRPRPRPVGAGLLRRVRRPATQARGGQGVGRGLTVSSRLYPARPIVGGGGIILDGPRVVLIKRKYEPLANRWSLPGGSLEVGEHLEDGTARELLEETGLVVEVGPVVEVFDRIQRDEDGRVRYHFVLVDYLCRPT